MMTWLPPSEGPNQIPMHTKGHSALTTTCIIQTIIDSPAKVTIATSADSGSGQIDQLRLSPRHGEDTQRVVRTQPLRVADVHCIRPVETVQHDDDGH